MLFLLYQENEKGNEMKKHNGIWYEVTMCGAGTYFTVYDIKGTLSVKHSITDINATRDETDSKAKKYIDQNK